MGLTGTATSFALSNRTVTDVGSPVDGPGTPGPYLNNAGHVTYYRVIKHQKKPTIIDFNNLPKRILKIENK
jgi:hypothetical protein